MEDSEQRTMSMFASRDDFVLALVADLKRAADSLHSGLVAGDLGKLEIAARWVDLVLATDNLLDESPTMRQLRLRDDQAAALKLMLDHFGGDPRVQCMRELLEASPMGLCRQAAEALVERIAQCRRWADEGQTLSIEVSEDLWADIEEFTKR